MGNSMKTHFSSLPNLLTLVRFLLVAPVGYSVLMGHFEIALALFLFASLSDLIDGWLARRFAWESSLGRLLDPAADKILLLTVLISLTLSDVLPMWAGVTLVLRDVLLLMAAATYRYLVGYLRLAPSVFGKLCLAAIMTLVVMLLFTRVDIPFVSQFSKLCVDWGLVSVVTVVSFVSLIEYLWSYGTDGVAQLRARGR